MKNIRLITIRFNAEIAHHEIPAFRAAIAQKAGHEHTLFHNHNEDGSVLYRYPAIQYKKMGRNAALICIEDGVDEIHHFFKNRSWNINISNRDIQLQVESLNLNQLRIQFSPEFRRYNIRDWLPLNAKNYKEFMTCSEEEKGLFLSKILIGNIISFAKGIKWDVDQEIKLSIEQIKHIKKIRFKGQELLGFDVEFKSNLFLPNWIGLGKGVSHGMGVIKEIK